MFNIIIRGMGSASGRFVSAIDDARGRLRAGHGGVRIIRNVSIGARGGIRGIGERTIHDSEGRFGYELVGPRARVL